MSSTQFEAGCETVGTFRGIYADFHNCAAAWRWLASLREDSGTAWIPEDENDPDGPQCLDSVQIILERFERNAMERPYSSTGEVLDESRGIRYRVKARD